MVRPGRAALISGRASPLPTPCTKFYSSRFYCSIVHSITDLLQEELGGTSFLTRADSGKLFFDGHTSHEYALEAAMEAAGELANVSRPVDSRSWTSASCTNIPSLKLVEERSMLSTKQFDRQQRVSQDTMPSELASISGRNASFPMQRDGAMSATSLFGQERAVGERLIDQEATVNISSLNNKGCVSDREPSSMMPQGDRQRNAKSLTCNPELTGHDHKGGHATGLLQHNKARQANSSYHEEVEALSHTADALMAQVCQPYDASNVYYRDAAGSIQDAELSLTMPRGGRAENASRLTCTHPHETGKENRLLQGDKGDSSSLFNAGMEAHSLKYHAITGQGGISLCHGDAAEDTAQVESNLPSGDRTPEPSCQRVDGITSGTIRHNTIPVGVHLSCAYEDKTEALIDLHQVSQAVDASSQKEGSDSTSKPTYEDGKPFVYDDRAGDSSKLRHGTRVGAAQVQLNSLDYSNTLVHTGDVASCEYGDRDGEVTQLTHRHMEDESSAPMTQKTGTSSRSSYAERREAILPNIREVAGVEILSMPEKQIEHSYVCGDRPRDVNNLKSIAIAGESRSQGEGVLSKDSLEEQSSLSCDVRQSGVLNVSSDGIRRGDTINMTSMGRSEEASTQIDQGNHANMSQSGAFAGSTTDIDEKTGKKRDDNQLEGNVTRMSSSNVIRFLMDRIKSKSLPELDEEVKRYKIELKPPEVVWLLKAQKSSVKAWEFFKWASSQPRYKHDATCYATMIDLLGRAFDFTLLEELLAEMDRTQLPYTVYVINSLIATYTTAEQINKAEQYFIKLQQLGLKPTAFTYRCMLQAFAKAGRCFKALDIYNAIVKEGQPLDTVSYNMLLDGLSKNGQVDTVGDIFKSMKQARCIPDVYTFTILARTFGNTGNVDKALELLEEMPKSGIEPNKFTYNAILAALANLNRVDDALQLLKKMLKSGVDPDFATYQTTIKMLCKRRQLPLAYDVIKELDDQVMKEDAYECFIKVLGKMGYIRDMCALFKRLKDEQIQPSASVYLSMIGVLCKAAEPEKSLALLEEMEKSGLKCSIAMCNAIIAAFRNNNKFEVGFKLFKRMKKSGPPPDIVTYNILIAGLTKAGKLELAEGLFEDIIKSGCMPNVITYNSLMHSFARLGDINATRRLLQTMQDKGITPDIVTYNSVIECFSKAGKTDIALKVFEEMKEKGCSPSFVTYNIILQALEKAGLAESALSLYEQMKEEGFVPDALTITVLARVYESSPHLNKEDLMAEVKKQGLSYVL